MKWEGNRESDNVEDRRGSGGGGGGGGGFLGGGKIGIGSIIIALAASYFLGINPLTVLGFLGGGDAPQTQQVPKNTAPATDEQTRFVRTTLALTEDVWKDVFTKGGATYASPKLVIFRGSTPTPCGAGQSAMGPFYCPADQKVYIDLAFFDTLKRQLGAGGDFAQAYVVAHEIGHHVQNLLGVNDKVEQARRRLSEKENNALSVRVELQADCYAGLWAKKANESRQILQSGDIEEAMNAAAKIGDDALQRQSTGQVRPDSFTHGTSAQRTKWFNVGLQTGSVKSCDTFSTRDL
jgi:predicted metalloprotease